jgi:hypothetical protein
MKSDRRTMKIGIKEEKERLMRGGTKEKRLW